MSEPTIGVVLAVCDHFQLKSEKPILSVTLKQMCGVTREQLRKWVKQGRLVESNVTLPNRQIVKAYSRPK